jgi:CheY-like chemotaxis protein
LVYLCKELMTTVDNIKKYWLLIDDDEDDLFVFGDTVSKHFPEKSFVGFQSFEQFNAVKNEIDCSSVEYIFLDLNMPRVNGMEALDQLAKIDELKNIPVIIYSTSNNPNDVNSTLKKGARAFITKPSTIGELVDELTVYVNKQSV